MKCIKDKKTGNVSRVPDFLAASLVEKKLAVYVGKEEWKKMKGASK